MDQVIEQMATQIGAWALMLGMQMREFLLLLLLLAAAIVVVLILLLQRRKLGKRLPKDYRSRLNRGKLKKADRQFAAQKYKDAAKLYGQVGLIDQAATAMEKLGDAGALAQFWIEHSRPEKAAEVWFKSGDYLQAAVQYEQAGNRKMALKAYAKGGQYVPAAQIALDLELFEQAAKLFARGGDIASALELFLNEDMRDAYVECVYQYLDTNLRGQSGNTVDFDESIVDWSKAVEWAFDQQAWSMLATIAPYCQRWDYAARAVEHCGQIEHAIELYQRAELFDESARLLEQNGQPLEAETDLARHHEQMESWAEAAYHYVKAGKSEYAVEFWEKAGQPEKAAEILYNLGRMEEAASIYERSGNYKQAGQAYLAADDKTAAAQCLAKTDEKVRAASLFVEMNEFKEAAELYDVLNMDDEALQAFQKHIRANPKDTEASLRVAELLEAKELFTGAAETYNTLIGGRPVSDRNIDFYYRLARLYERMKKWSQARLVYEKILAFDVSFEDTSDRVTSIKRHEMLNDIGSQSSDQNSQGTGEGKRYHIEQELGRGGMGMVYLAEDTLLKRKVALKVLQTNDLDQSSVERMMDEARISARLNHENIVTIFDVSVIEGNVYLSMEYVEGQSLADIIHESGPLPLTPLLLLFGQACMGLGYAHAQEVIHRDIKPANLMWTPERKLKIMDFGLAVAMQEMANTQTLVAGTPYYMSPEQVMGDPSDPRSDIYSLGVTMFEAATGQRPFSGRDVGYHHVHTQAKKVHEVRTDLPPQLGEIVAKCMAKKPDDRYSDAKALLADIKALIKSFSS